MVARKKNEIYERVLLSNSLPLRLAVCPSAIREHFEMDDAVAELSKAQLMEIGEHVLTSDTFYQAFHEALCAAIEDVAGFNPDQKDMMRDAQKPALTQPALPPRMAAFIDKLQRMLFQDDTGVWRGDIEHGADTIGNVCNLMHEYDLAVYPGVAEIPSEPPRKSAPRPVDEASDTRVSAEVRVLELRAAVVELLGTTELNLDEMEPHTRHAVLWARRIVDDIDRGN